MYLMNDGRVCVTGCERFDTLNENGGLYKHVGGLDKTTAGTRNEKSKKEERNN